MSRRGDARAGARPGSPSAASRPGTCGARSTRSRSSTDSGRRPRRPAGAAPYNAAMASPAPPPYAGLTPDRVLDALDSVGITGDGRLLALNSYENRVYQVWQDDGARVVAKFYRPARWTDAQILEEHALVAELAERDIPVVAALPDAAGATLHEFAGFRFAVYPQRGGRAPELEDRATLEWMGRFIGRMHAVGAVRPLRRPPGAGHRELRRGAARLAARARLRARGPAPRVRERRRAGARRRPPLLRPRRRGLRPAPARRLPRRQRAVDRRRPALRRLRRLPDRARGAGPVDAARGRPGRHDAPARARPERLRATSSTSTGASCTWSRRCARCASSTTRRGSRGAGTIPRSRRRFPGSTATATGRTGSWSCASRSR